MTARRARVTLLCRTRFSLLLYPLYCHADGRICRAAPLRHFGATGDLARRKLLPALYRLASEREALEACHILGVARSERSDSGFR